MTELKLWNIRWAVDESAGLYRMLREIPTPEFLSYWITGQSMNDDRCTYMGVIAAANETDAIQILLHNVQPVTEISWVRPYVMSPNAQDNFNHYMMSYNLQRTVYFKSLGLLYDKPVVSHTDYDGWECITLTELL